MRYRLVDAFTDRAFSGNPAVVVLLEGPDWPETELMQALAMEFSVSETAFARPLFSSDDADWALRWFTPLVEDDLCGHATLATAHALHSDRGRPGRVRFETRSGILTATTDVSGVVTLDFPRAQLTEVDQVEGLNEALGIDPLKIVTTGSLGDFLVVLPSETSVRSVAPDHEALVAIQRRSPSPDRGVIVTAVADDGTDYDFVSRYFAPSAGILEDPVTGSAHTALAPYWSQALGREHLTGLQMSKRTGKIAVQVSADRVFLSGHGVTVAEGRLVSPAITSAPGLPRIGE